MKLLSNMTTGRQTCHSLIATRKTSHPHFAIRIATTTGNVVNRQNITFALKPKMETMCALSENAGGPTTHNGFPPGTLEPMTFKRIFKNWIKLSHLRTKTVGWTLGVGFDLGYIFPALWVHAVTKTLCVPIQTSESCLSKTLMKNRICRIHACWIPMQKN